MNIPTTQTFRNEDDMGRDPNKPGPDLGPVENDMHVRSGVAHGEQTTELDFGNGPVDICNICGKPA